MHFRVFSLLGGGDEFKSSPGAFFFKVFLKVGPMLASSPEGAPASPAGPVQGLPEPPPSSGGGKSHQQGQSGEAGPSGGRTRLGDLGTAGQDEVPAGRGELEK